MGTACKPSRAQSGTARHSQIQPGSVGHSKDEPGISKAHTGTVGHNEAGPVPDK